MDQPTVGELLNDLRWLGPLALLVFVVLLRRGTLGARSFADIRPRATGLGFIDLGVLVLIWALGNGIVAAVLLQMGWISQDPDAAKMSPGQAAMAALIAQTMIQGPLVLYLLLRLRGRPGGIAELGIKPKNPRREIYQGLQGVLAALPLVLFVSVLTMMLSLELDITPPKVGHEMLEQFISAHSVLAMVGLGLSALVLAPILEEIIFRGLVQNVFLEELNGRHWPALLLAALVFTLVHGTGGVSWQAFPGLMVLAVILGWLYERTGSLLPGIITHCGFNVFNVILAVAASRAPGPETAPAAAVIHWMLPF